MNKILSRGLARMTVISKFALMYDSLNSKQKRYINDFIGGDIGGGMQGVESHKKGRSGEEE